jgi:dTDP-4-amino-4,6-dideoxygalactose transaminase
MNRLRFLEHAAPGPKGASEERIFLSPPHMSGEELRFIQEAFQSNYIAPLGPQVDAFEREFSERVGISHSVALSSGTAAIHLALRQLKVEPGDEIFASALTFIGSVTPIVFEGAIPVFVDADRDTWNLSPDLLAEELEACRKGGRMPKAVIPTDIYGQCADMDRILEVCEPYSIPVVVDSAEALGATYRGRHAGSGARAAVYSFNGNKIITTSGGGMLASEDKEFIEHARFLSQQARDSSSHYEHSEIGYNYRMSNILAAIGRGQLRVLDERIEKKRWIFNFYRNSLSDIPGIQFMPEAPYGRCTRWLTVILITPGEFGTDRETVRIALEAENIESRPVWKPMHLQPVFKICEPQNRIESNSSHNCRARAIGGTVSEDLFNRGLCLPSGTQMSEDDLMKIVKIIRDVHFKSL